MNSISTRVTFDLFGNPDTITGFDRPSFVGIDEEKTVIVAKVEIRTGMETSTTLSVLLDQFTDHLNRSFSCLTSFQRQSGGGGED